MKNPFYPLPFLCVFQPVREESANLVRQCVERAVVDKYAVILIAGYAVIRAVAERTACLLQCRTGHEQRAAFLACGLPKTGDLLRLTDMYEKQLLIAPAERFKLLCAVAERKIVEFGAALLELGKKTPGRRGFDTIPACGACDLQNGRDGRDISRLPEGGCCLAYRILSDSPAAVYNDYQFVHADTSKQLSTVIKK